MSVDLRDADPEKEVVLREVKSSMIWLSSGQRDLLKELGLREHLFLPCWASQRRVSKAIFNSIKAVELAEAHHGPFLWATEFSNVHSTFNFTEPGFIVNGKQYRGPEQFFQLSKSEGTPDWARASELMEHASDSEAFSIGRRFALRSDWEDVKMDVMKTAVRAKFSQNDSLRHLLLATGDHTLVQIKPSDAFWGTGPDGKGRNALGLILMDIREEMKGDSK